MVDDDSRNNIIVIIILIATAIIVTSLIYLFSLSVFNIAHQSQQDIENVGKSLTGNISAMLLIDQMKILTLNKTIAHMDKFNYEGILKIVNLTEETNNILNKTLAVIQQQQHNKSI